MLSLSPSAQSAENKIRIAFGDIASVETLNFLIAIERAKEHGVDIEVTYLKDEDIAAQAVVGGQADVGVGTPYALLQKVKAPIRMFYQMSTLRFFPIVNTEFYKSWKDLDGQEVAVQSRGSGTEAIMKLMAQKHGITYSQHQLRPGLRGARAARCCRATIKATDRRRREPAHARGEGARQVRGAADRRRERHRRGALRQHRVPRREQAADVDILVEELLKTWREITANPAVVADLRKKYNLLPDLGPQADAEIVPYYKEIAGGRRLSAQWRRRRRRRRTTSASTALAGQIEGDPATLKVEDFWDFGPLDRALAKLGRS